MSGDAGMGMLQQCVAAFVTIVLAIAVSDMVHSTHRLLRKRGKVKWSALPLIAALFVVLAVLSEFFELWTVTDATSFSFFELVALMVTPTLLALAACAVLPDEVPDGGLDLEEFYRRYFYAVIAIAVLGDLIGNIREAWRATDGTISMGHPLWWLAIPLAGLTFFLCLLLAWSNRRWVHGVGLLGLLGVALFGFSV